MLNRFMPMLLLVGAGLLAAGCNRSQDGSTLGGTVRIDGSSTVFPVTEAVAEEFSIVHPRVRTVVGFSGTGGGFKKFSAGETDISNASRPIKESEIEACRANEIEYFELQVAYDGLAVIAHPENDWADCLTVDQLNAIWQPESAVSKWSDVNPAWPDEELKLYGPGTDSGTFDYFTEVIVGEAKRSRSDYTASEDDNVLVIGVSGDRNSLGYFGFAYYEENKSRLKLLAVDNGDGRCVQPSVDTVLNGEYQPLSRPLFIYVNKASLARPEVREFLQFYLEHASELAKEVGYVPVPDDVAAENRRVLDEALAAQPADSRQGDQSPTAPAGD